MVANNWLCQLIADVAAVPVERPAFTETTALGAAMLAAVGAGVAPSLEATRHDEVVLGAGTPRLSRSHA